MTQFVSGSVLTASSLNTAFNTATIATATTNYTVGSVNAGELVLLNSASAGTVTIPLDATYNFATGTIIEMYNSGAGSWSIATAGTASTVSGTSTTLSQYQASRLIKTAPSTWFVDGGAGAANAVLKTGTSSTSGTMDFSGSVVKGAGLDLISPTSIANSGGSATNTNGSVAYSAVSSVSLNGVFSSTYENYRILVRLTHSASNDTIFRLRVAGVDNTTSNYIHQRLNASSTSTFPNRATTAYGPVLEGANTNVWASLDMTNPFTTEITQWYSYGVGAATASLENKTLAGVHNVTSSFDGITLYPSAGTITGTIRVYGYRNS